jgi:chemotaxis methyl-accepting protein methylase
MSLSCGRTSDGICLEVHSTFCRNLVLTYFERPPLTHVLRSLTARLKCGGYLVIGAHEAMPESVTGFQPLSRCRAILCRQGSPASFERVA